MIFEARAIHRRKGKFFKRDERGGEGRRFCVGRNTEIYFVGGKTSSSSPRGGVIKNSFKSVLENAEQKIYPHMHAIKFKEKLFSPALKKKILKSSRCSSHSKISR